ncbi:MAG TPA: type II toxin-antitoxin system ParD family antitoxin [Gemmataceae bacterium]|nr:type II toxin-antitoxin system ParD family antitoxin [Gemmataceae bacterium]
MTITLPPDYQRFIEQLVGEGGYQSAADVVCDGLELLRAQTVYRQQRLAELRRQVEVGLAQMRCGQVSPADPMKLLDEVEQEFASPPEAQP